MPKIFFHSVAFLGAALLLASCTPQTTNTNNEPTNTSPSPTPTESASPSPSPVESPSITPTPVAGVPAVNFVEYENKAVGYRIQRPDKWYWQHYIRSEIGENAPLVDDYFITDRKPLPQLGSEYLGSIVIEVLRRTEADVADSVAGFTKTEATVGGQTASRYEGVRNNEQVTNQKWIEYRFTRNSRLFRLIFAQTNASPTDSAAFENMVKSFAFSQ